MSSAKSKRTLGMGRPKLTAKSSNNNKLKKSIVTISDDDDGPQVTPQLSFLNRENQLSNLFSSQENNSRSNNQGKKKASLKYNQFEEDGEFIYKRSQSPIQLQSRKKRKVNTPVSQLHEEIDLLARDDLDSDSEDIFALKKSRKKERKSRKNQHSTSGTRLRSPLGDGYNSDDYIEHVSLERLPVQDHPGRSASNKRRQSYINRGKRVSSIGNGFTGEPHKDVPVTDYYKLLDTSLPAPDRMRQLLIWCLKKQLEKDDEALKNNPTVNQTAASIARVIKEELINDLIEKKISTSWYGKKNTVSGKVITVPNPINESNRKNIELYSKQVDELRKQKAEWQRVFGESIAPIENLNIRLRTDTGGLKKYLEKERAGEIGLDAIDGFAAESIEQSYKNLKELFGQLKPTVDKLYFSSYQLNQAAKLIKIVEETKLGPQVAQHLDSYVNRKIEPQDEPEASSSSSASTTSAKPVNRFDTMDLLKAICYVETKRPPPQK
ncbi:Kinetochore protein mis13 [Candida viswanathii]|uniref:Kinetochore protein mis13 n=1 Tax=Candida viswanathii TaxID=5486 RepID=A0A367XPT7_9ASCO|nr:Kinetochore protein mis13 [Candida viswanathii]RCK60538.1 Kinetochore protein mis13 [Candida viswanathii]